MSLFFAKHNISGFLIDGIFHLSPREALHAIERGAVLIDLRDELEIELKRFKVSGILYLSSQEVKSTYKTLEKEKAFVIADSVGLQSKEIVRFLKENGFENVANLIGGIVDWQREELPMHIDGFLTGSCACKLKKKKVNTN